MRTLVLEGVNGAGKTTIGALLRDRLVERGRSCVAADPAACGRLGGLERKHVVSTSFACGPDVDTLLFAALRIDGVQRLLLDSPELAKDGILILERWSLAVRAYGIVDGARSQLLEALAVALDETISVDATVLLDVAPAIAEARIGNDTEENRFQSRGLAYLEQLRAAHLALSENVGRLVVVDASADTGETLERVVQSLAAAASDLHI